MAEPDPRDYVLVPVEDLYEDIDPMYRSAAHYEQVNLHFVYTDLPAYSDTVYSDIPLNDTIGMSQMIGLLLNYLWL